MKLYFGKHEGKELENVDSGYLKWLSQNIEDDEIATAADVEYRRREDDNEHIWKER
jgi:hypothetical protein